METEAVPDLALADLIFTLRTPRYKSKHADAAKQLLEAIEAENLAPLYTFLSADVPAIKLSDAKYKKLVELNTIKIDELKQAIDDATDAEDELAIVEGWVGLGNYYARICDREQAVTTLRRALELTASAGSKIDIMLTIVRIGLFFNDKRFTQKEIDQLQKLIESDGDWERKNRYKTYRGMFLMSVRQFSEAADLLIDSFATFTSSELTSYEKVVAYGIVCGALSLDRVDLKKKIVDSSEILSLLTTSKLLEPLTEMTNSLYTGEYGTFLEALARVEQDVLLPSWYLAPHASYYVREMRARAYAQLLESYMALNIKSMADTFGVTVNFLDADLSRLIPQKKLNCVVDKVNGVIVTNRPDTKNAQYQQLVKQGDALLTKLQKYGAAVRLHGADQQ